jgi:preprotein translocase subunit SecB
MEVNKQSKLTFHGVDIINVNFNAIAPREQEINVLINCVPKVFYPVEHKKFFKIIMDIELKDERYFELDIRAVGTFELELEIDSELKKTFVNSNAPAIMFPYIRSFISTLTANLGNVVGALVIPTQFFKGELEEIKEENSK